MNLPQPQGWPPVIRGAVAFVMHNRLPLIAFGGLRT